MSKFKRCNTGLVLLIFTILFSFSCSSEEAQKIIRVGTTPNYPPLIFKTKNKYLGIEAELATLLSKELRCEIKYIEIPMNSIFSALEEGKVDMIMSGISVTYERQSQVQFLFPFMTISQMAIVRTENEPDYESVDDIYNSKAKFGFEQGTTGELFVKENIPLSEKFPFPSPDKGLLALKEKKIDIFIYDSPLIWKITNENQDQDFAGLFWPLTEEDVAWAVNKNNAELNHLINMAILKWKKNGTLNRVINRWIKVKRTFVAWAEMEE